MCPKCEYDSGMVITQVPGTLLLRYSEQRGQFQDQWDEARKVKLLMKTAVSVVEWLSLRKEG